VRRIDEASNGTIGCEIDYKTTSAAEKMSMVGFAQSGETEAFYANATIFSTPRAKERETESLLASFSEGRMMASIRGRVGVTSY